MPFRDAITIERVEIPTTCTFDGGVIGEVGVRLFNHTWVSLSSLESLQVALEERVDENEYGRIGHWPWTCLLLPHGEKERKTRMAEDTVESVYDQILGDEDYDARRAMEPILYDIGESVAASRCAECGEPARKSSLLYFGYGDWIHSGCVSDASDALEATMSGEDFSEVLSDALVDNL